MQDVAEPESPRTPLVGSTGFDLPPKVTEGEIDDSEDDDEPQRKSPCAAERKGVSTRGRSRRKEEGKTLRTEGLYRVVLGANKGS